MIDKKVTSEKCLGCGACFNICPKSAITLIKDSFGFIIPKVDYSKCINCQACLNVCPALNKYISKPALPKVYSARITENDTLSKSTSGGVFTAISDYILSKNGYICGAIYNESFVVNHVISQSKEVRDQMRGAKYVQSYIGSCFKQIRDLLNQDNYVLFVGTPCQVHALKLFLKKEYEKLFTIDIVCHGVPSPLFFENFLSYLTEKYGQIKAVRFRSKNYGWRGNNLEITFADGKSLCNVKDTKKYTNLYGRSYMMRNCCFSCNYTSIFRVGDFTLGDYWGIENVESKLNDNKGCSILFVNSQKAEECFNNIKNRLIVEEREIPDILQPNLISPTRKPNGVENIQNLIKDKNYWKKI